MDKLTQNDLIELDNKYKNINFDINNIETSNISNFITDKHIDVIVKYLYVKAYIEKKDYHIYKSLYEKMQLKRVNKSYYKEFNMIIDSFKKNGYLKNYPIPVNNDLQILNGSHRLACCLYFNINPYIYKINNPDHCYDLSWFKENKFTDEEIQIILQTKDDLLNRYNSRNSIKLEKCYDAMITKINGTNLDFDYIVRHSKFLKKNGINGLFLCGNTGAGMNMNFDIKKELIQKACKYLQSDFSLIVHVGCNNINEIDKMIRLINAMDGVDAIASMPPYIHINTFQKIKKYYEELAMKSNKQLIIYHIPTVTNIDLNAPELVELLSINNVIGIKYTDSDLDKVRYIKEHTTDKYIFFGKDDYLLDGLNAGATGGIGGCYNLFPSFIVNIIKGNEKYQYMLNYCIKKLRSIYPTLPGSDFVLKSLEIKKNMNDIEFYHYLGGKDD